MDIPGDRSVLLAVERHAPRHDAHGAHRRCRSGRPAPAFTVRAFAGGYL